MTHPLSETFGLSSPDGRTAQLLTVAIAGEILGPMLRLTVRQTWRNTSGAPMAAQLRFPLAWDQQLMDLHMQRAGHSERLSKVLREDGSTCLCTLGVLGIGEQVVLHWRLTQSLQTRGASLRWVLPAGLAPHPARGLDLSLDIHDPVAQCTVSSPSHDLQRVRHGNGLRLSLCSRGGLDKDLVLTAHGLKDKVLAVAGAGLNLPERLHLLAAVCTAEPAADQPMPRQPLRMKLLIDQTVHMSSDRLGQARTALDHLLRQLQADDQVSLSRFGSKLQHDLPRVQACTEAYRKRLCALVRRADPCDGTTSAEDAVLAVLGLTNEDDAPLPLADILLITANPLGAIETLRGRLRQGKHRLHVLMLEAGDHSLWAQLAQTSGGACETLASGQPVQPALSRLVARMRHLQPWHAELDLEGTQCLSCAVTPTWVTEGDTLQVWSEFSAQGQHRDLAGQPTLKTGFHWHLSDAQHSRSLPPVTVLWDALGDVSRMAQLRQILALQDENERQQQLQAHGLYWPDSSRMRQIQPKVQTFNQRQPAATPVSARPAQPGTENSPSMAAPRNPAASAMQRTKTLAHTGQLPDWLQTLSLAGNPLLALVQSFNAQAQIYTQFRAALSGTLKALPLRSLDGLVLQLSRQAGNPGRVWALLLHWLHVQHDLPLNEQALALLEQELATTAVAVRNDIHAALQLACEPRQQQAAA